VPQERVMKYSPENLLKQQELRNTSTAQKQKGPKIEKKSESATVKKRRRDSMIEKVCND
jgi:hypothetical protein